MDGLTFLLIYIAGIALLLYIDRKNWEFHFPLFMKKTQRGVSFLKNLGKKYSRFWNIYGTLGVVVCVPAAILMVAMLGWGVLQIAEVPEMGPGAKLLLPIQVNSPYALYIPWYYFFFAVVVLVIVHEFSHGLVAISQKLKIKNLGAIFLLVIPGAFVEPDEDQLKKTDRMKRMRVYAAGSWANFIVAFFTVILLLFLVAPLFNSCINLDGVQISSVSSEFPAEKAGLEAGMVVNSINDVNIKTLSEFYTAIQNVKPGEKINLKTDKGNFEVVTVSSPKDSTKAYLGVGLVQKTSVQAGKETMAQIMGFIYGLLNWVFIVNLGVGLFNLIPLKPLDGGHLIADFIEAILPKKISPLATKVVTCLTIILLFLTFFGHVIFGFLS